MRSKINLIVENRQSKLDTELKLSQQKLKKLKHYYVKLHKEGKMLEQTNATLNESNKVLNADVAVSNQQLNLLTDTQQQLAKKTDQYIQALASISELKTLNEQLQKSSQEKLQLLQSNKEELKIQFKSLAHDIFEEKDKKFSAQNKERLDAILNPFNQQLTEFKKKVEDNYHNEGKQRESLITEVRNLRELNNQLNIEALNLTRALKGDNKQQGNWGELILERILEQSGLRKGHEYQAQEGHRNSDNSLLKPDVIIHLPQNKDVIVDSKVSLVAYEKYTSAETEGKKNQALKQHMSAMKNHINNLSDKDYSNLAGINSLDFVLMFIPIEPAFMLAFQQDDRLFTDAFTKKIVVVTPTTLLATLKTIENLWRYEKQNQNARDIANRAGNLYDKFRGFIEDVEKLGKQLDTTQVTYHDALNKLTKGKGNLVNQAQQLLDLGVKVKKEIPQTVIEKAELENINKKAE